MTNEIKALVAKVAALEKALTSLILCYNTHQHSDANAGKCRTYDCAKEYTP
jgi:hypothetical protein